MNIEICLCLLGISMCCGSTEPKSDSAPKSASGGSTTTSFAPSAQPTIIQGGSTGNITQPPQAATKPDEKKKDATKPDEKKKDASKPDDKKKDASKPDNKKKDATKSDDKKKDASKPDDKKKDASKPDDKKKADDFAAKEREQIAKEATPMPNPAQ